MVEVEHFQIKMGKYETILVLLTNKKGGECQKGHQPKKVGVETMTKSTPSYCNNWKAVDVSSPMITIT